MKELCHLDLHRGLEAHEMDARPHVWGTIYDELFTLKMKDVSFGGFLASLEDEISPFSTWTFPFGGLNLYFEFM
jgi:hypothetical protein